MEGAGNVAQGIKALAAQFDPVTHVVEGKDWLLLVLPWCPRVHHSALARSLSQAHMHTKNKYNNFFLERFNYRLYGTMDSTQDF